MVRTEPPVPPCLGSSKLCLRTVPIDYGMFQTCSPLPMSYQGTTGCPCEPGLPQGFSIMGAAPGPSSLLLLSIRGEATGRSERSLHLASLHAFFSCLSLTDIVPSVSLASRQQCRGQWKALGRGTLGMSLGLSGARESHAGQWVQSPARGLFPSEVGGPGASNPTARGVLAGAAGLLSLQAERRKRKMCVGCFSFLLLPSFSPSFLPTAQLCHHTLRRCVLPRSQAAGSVPCAPVRG